jgi:adenosylcobyric acid synthase
MQWRQSRTLVRNATTSASLHRPGNRGSTNGSPNGSLAYDSLVPSLMIQGVSSNAGKSLVVTALCRWLSRQGVMVAPFKAQNMSNNARVVDGGEIGTAQWLQALAAKTVPDVRMNPILLKPEGDTRSQVVLDGVVNHDLTNAPWRGRSKKLWPHVSAAYDSLSDEYDVIVIEGAGSPAETNLWVDDIVNMAVADYADAPVALVADIDRGGAFAHLYGTWALLPPEWQRRVEGFLLNKFRGDATLLDPAPRDLEALCGVATIGVIPWLEHALPDEEGPTTSLASTSGPQVSIVCGPYASNLDEFVALQQAARVTWVRTRHELSDSDLVIIPGSKNVARDLQWLRATGLDADLHEAALAGTPLLGICGGLQMLGRRVLDPEGVEGEEEGLDLLALETSYERNKRTTRSTIDFGDLGDSWAWLKDRHVSGYEIRHGVTRAASEIDVTDGHNVFGSRNVLGIYLHGLFEDPDVLRAFSGAGATGLETTFELLADAIDDHVDGAWLRRRLGI